MAVYGNAYQWGGYPLPTAPIPKYNGRAWFVDGTNGLDGNSGRSPKNAFASIGQAVEDNPDLQEGDVIYVFPKTLDATDTDPDSYAETFILDTPQVAIIGIGSGAVQGALPQVRIGAGSTAMLTIRAPGCTIQGLGFNGASSTGGGILLDDDGGSTKAAFGTVVRGCHFKNCKGHATNGSLGGAIAWATAGNAWQVLIEDCAFYKNVCDICLIGTGSSRPQDVYIRGCKFSGPAASVDVNIYGAGGSGFDGIYIDNCVFPCFPAIGSGTNTKQLALTGCVGSITNCGFGGSKKTFGAAGNNLVPTTVLLGGNYQENDAGTSGEIGRT
jgi:hypothetical protein